MNVNAMAIQRPMLGAGVETVERSVGTVAALLVVHAMLAVAMKNSATLATIHSGVTILTTLLVASFALRRCWIVCAAAYIVGAEVLWRMCGAGGPWELGKYGVTVVLLVGLVRMRQYVLTPAALLYAALLVPGAIVAAANTLYMPLLPRLTTHLSGPLALAMCLMFFNNCRLTGQELNRVLMALAIPISSVCFVAARGTFSRNIAFGSQSLKAASGDFGPNQVSAVLGLGALVLFLYLICTPTGTLRKILIGGVSMACLSQSALTLSR